MWNFDTQKWVFSCFYRGTCIIFLTMIHVEHEHHKDLYHPVQAEVIFRWVYFPQHPSIDLSPSLFLSLLLFLLFFLFLGCLSPLHLAPSFPSTPPLVFSLQQAIKGGVCVLCLRVRRSWWVIHCGCVSHADTHSGNVLMMSRRRYLVTNEVMCCSQSAAAVCLCYR